MRFYEDGKRYRTFSGYLKQEFGCRVHKVSLDSGADCPNRDGTRGMGGCIYCSNEGFSYNTARARVPIESQLDTGIDFMRQRFGARKFIAYFQAFSSTHVPADTLRRQLETALSRPEVVGLSISTRPDCVPDDVLDLIASFRERALTWLELGLQSSNEETLQRINRCHRVADFDEAVKRAALREIPVCAHVILGLPGEDRSRMLTTAGHLAALPVRGLKLHALHVLRGAELEQMYGRGEVRLLTMEEYVALACDFLELTRPEVVVQRLAADAPRRELVAPEWCAWKLRTMNGIERELARRDSFQGRAFSGPDV